MDKPEYPDDCTTLRLSMTGADNLKTALQLSRQIFSKIVAYKVEKNTMILYWHDKGKDIQKLPYPMTPDQAAQFVWGWLENTLPDYPEPDTDGSTGKAWELYARSWSVWENETYAYITIRPIWFIYGK